MKLRMVIMGLVLAVVLALSSGTFAHFIYPGPNTPSVQVLPATVQPYVSSCDRLRDKAFTDIKNIAVYSSWLRQLGCMETSR